MAENRRRRWLQFGILDLLILTTIVAVVVGLSRPVPANACKAKPWVIGAWLHGDDIIVLYPDGYYAGSRMLPNDEGLGWRLSRHDTLEDAFVLTCGKQRYVIRSEWGSGALELLSDDGGVRSKATQLFHWEGPSRDGALHGTWRVARPSVGASNLTSLEYRNGELIDVRRSDGTRNWTQLNQARRLRGLPELSLRDSSDEPTAKEQRRD